MPALIVLFGNQVVERINLSLVRLRLLFPDSAAGALFLFFGVFTLRL